MMVNTEIKERLGKLKLRCRPEVVREIIQGFRAGDSVYQIYHVQELASKGTATKIKSLYDSKQLDFLFDLDAGLEVALIASRDFDPTSNRRPDSHSVDLEPKVESVSKVKLLISQLPETEWDIETLEGIGFTTDYGLTILKQRDSLYRSLNNPHAIKTNDIERYLQLNLIVYLTQEQSSKKNKADTRYIELAASLMSKGELNDNPFQKELGMAILRYQIWRGTKFIDAFNEMTSPWNKAARREKERVMRDVDRISNMVITDGQSNSFFMPSQPLENSN